jgi:hypothetical protein
MRSFGLSLNTVLFFLIDELLTLDPKKKKNATNLGFTVIYTVCAVVFLLGASGYLGQVSLLSTGNTHLGISTPGDFTDVNDANYKSASVFTAQESGTVVSITAMTTRVNTPGNVMTAIYATDSVGNPDALLGTSTKTYVSTSMNWVTFRLRSPVPVTIGRQYALAICSDDYLTVSVTSGTGVRIHNNNDYGSFSSPFNNGWGIQPDIRGAMSIYANITEGSAPTVSPDVIYIPRNRTENTSLIMAVFGGAGAGLSALALVLVNFRKVKTVG